MSSPLDVAIKRAAVLEAELKQVQQFIAMYEAFSRADEGVAKEHNGTDLKAPVSSVTSKNQSVEKIAPRVRRRRGGGPTPTEIVDTTTRMIREAGQPLTRGDIAAMFEARDIELPGEDKARYVGTIMWRNKAKFVNVEGRGYWLRGEPVPTPIRTILDDVFG